MKSSPFSPSLQKQTSNYSTDSVQHFRNQLVDSEDFNYVGLLGRQITIFLHLPSCWNCVTIWSRFSLIQQSDLCCGLNLRTSPRVLIETAFKAYKLHKASNSLGIKFNIQSMGFVCFISKFQRLV